MSAPRFEILDYRESALGVLVLRRRELLSAPGTVVTEVTLDHEFLMSSHNTVSERELARRGLEFHGGGGLRVLVGGLGLGYTAHTAMNSSQVAAVEVVELLPEVISWLARGLFPLADDLREDPRVRVVQGDVFVRLMSSDFAPDALFDVALVDVDHSPHELLAGRNAAFYGVEGLRRARERFTARGVLAIWSGAADDEFEAALREVFDEVVVERVAWFNELIDEQQHDVLFLARR